MLTDDEGKALFNQPKIETGVPDREVILKLVEEKRDLISVVDTQSLHIDELKKFKDELKAEVERLRREIELHEELLQKHRKAAESRLTELEGRLQEIAYYADPDFPENSAEDEVKRAWQIIYQLKGMAQAALKP